MAAVWATVAWIQNAPTCIPVDIVSWLMTETTERLVNAAGLLEVVFQDKSRPSLRWLKQKQAAGLIPFTKVGRLVWFDPAAVRQALLAQGQGGAQ
jgi:hypothetical protein